MYTEKDARKIYCNHVTNVTKENKPPATENIIFEILQIKTLAHESFKKLVTLVTNAISQ